MSPESQRYRYYASLLEGRFGATGQTLSRVPAAVVERAVVDQIRGVLTRPEAIAAVVNRARLLGY